MIVQVNSVMPFITGYQLIFPLVVCLGNDTMFADDPSVELCHDVYNRISVDFFLCYLCRQ